jgi:translation elongation factor EF-4
VERERGITVLAQTASMLYKSQKEKNKDETFLFNLIDTPVSSLSILEVN